MNKAEISININYYFSTEDEKFLITQTGWAILLFKSSRRKCWVQDKEPEDGLC